MIERKQWTFSTQQPTQQNLDVLSRSLNITPLTARLLWQRGFQTEAQASAYLTLGQQPWYDPYLLPDMQAAVTRIERALENKEPITVYGDYDVDGVTSTSALYLYLKQRGAVVDYYIPLRLKEGYGIHTGAVDALCQKGTRLVITVDTGITANEEIEQFASYGVDVVVTDHHNCRYPLPNAVAVVNPQRTDHTYPFREMAGVGVVFCLMLALEQSFAKRKKMDVDAAIKDLCDCYLDLVAIGTIADVMPLIDQNRTIVKWGLSRMESAPRVGLSALLSACAIEKGKKKINASLISFTVAPRINAAGRMGDAALGVELFLCENFESATAIAQQLCEWNRVRQNEENQIAQQAHALIEAEVDLEQDSVIVLAQEGWHSGVIGIVASRIAEHYHRPCILISIDGAEGKGSGRSIKGLHLVQGLQACAPYLIQFGGHELAAGLSIATEQIGPFRQALNAYATSHLAAADRVATLHVDAQVQPQELTLPQAEQLELLEPFGVQNPQPVFVLRDAQICEITPIGNAKHTKFLLQCGKQSLSCVWFGVRSDTLDYTLGEYVDIAFLMNVNEFGGNRSVQLVLKDMMRAKAEQQQIAKEIVQYYSLTQSTGAVCGSVPVYTQFAQVYRTLQRHFGATGATFGLYQLKALCQEPIGWAQIRFVLDVFVQLDFFELAVLCDEPLYLSYRITWKNTAQKVKLEQSALYRTLIQRKQDTKGATAWICNT